MRTLTWERVEQTTQAIINSERGWEATTSTELAPKIVNALNNHDSLLEALREITEGLGLYSEDRMQHAENTIESMKNIARKAIEKVEAPA